MDSLTDGTASLLRYDDRSRQLDLLYGDRGAHCTVHVATDGKTADGITGFKTR